MLETALVATFFPVLVWITLLSLGFWRHRRGRAAKQELHLVDHTRPVLLLLSLLALLSITLCIGYLFIFP